MKVILSRKGFDSSNGGIVSPIFEDNTMISFPIPSDDADSYDDLSYDGVKYSKILRDLNYKGKMTCHLDPDLDKGRRVVDINNWQPLFGQIDSSASYLKNIGIAEGDLFLFFGNFHHVKYENGKYGYIKKSGDFYKDNDLQVIWGYLQVGEIVEDKDKQKELYWHPHAIDKRTNNKTNLIFKAAKNLSFDKSKPGCGLLKFDKKRVLTLEGANKATWKMNSVYDTNHILSVRKNMAKDTSTGIYYAGIWQELGLCESSECTKWAESIIISSVDK